MKLIDGHAMIQRVKGLYKMGAVDLSYYNIVKEAVQMETAVDAVPVVHARWVKMTGMMPPEYHGHYECSMCQWHMKGLRNSWTREEELNYCPHCGAKMQNEYT